MGTFTSPALRGATLAALLAGACRDAPLEPRPSARLPLGAGPQSSRVQTFSGARADSVLEVLEAAWAAHGHPEYGQARHEWRQRNGVEGQSKSPRTPPAHDETPIIGNDGALRPPPRIISHNEALRFGWLNRDGGVPNSVEAEMVFIGDAGQITLNSLTITRSAGGAPYTGAGVIAVGPGEIVNCADALFGDCDNRRHLGGVILFPDAPRCDASGTGSVTFFATNLKAGLSVGAYGVSVSLGGVPDGASVSQGYGLNQRAAPCTTDGDDHNDPQSPTSDSTNSGSPTGAGGVPTNPLDPPATWPTPPSSDPHPAPYVDLWCQETDSYLVINGYPFLVDSVINCYKPS